jgi:hypothetical protein
MSIIGKLFVKTKDEPDKVSIFLPNKGLERNSMGPVIVLSQQHVRLYNTVRLFN